MIRLQIVVLLSILVGPLVLAAPIGRVTSLEGDVSVWRDSKPLESAKLIEGLELETDDLLVSGPQGKLEFLLDKATGVGARVKLGPGTQVVLEVTAAKRDQTATLEFLGGTLGALVPTLGEASRLRIQTSVGSLTTRGSTFSVTTALGGEMAVSASTGRVVCLIGGADYLAEAGSVVVVTPRPLEARNLSVNASTLDAWSQNWKAGIETDIRNRALAAFKFYGGRYLQQSGEFQRAWDRWTREGQSSSDKRLLENLTVNLRQSGLPLERDAFRLGELRALVAQGVVAETKEIAQSFTIKDFYRQFDHDLLTLPSRLARMRQLHKSALAGNDGSFPEMGELPVVTRESPFFN